MVSIHRVRCYSRLALLCFVSLAFFGGPALAGNPRFSIEISHSTPLGSQQEVSVYLEFDAEEPTAVNQISRFNLLFQYDTAFATFQYAEAGSVLIGCTWEAFSWSVDGNADCGGTPCPPGTISLSAEADVDNGGAHPLCLAESSGEIAVLHFQISDNPGHECYFSPIEFTWYSCSDNSASPGVGSDTVLLSDGVLNFVGWYGWYYNIAADAPFPTHFGAPSACLLGFPPGQVPIRAIDFEVPGGIDIVCADSIDERGDFNLNAIAYEIADAVYFANYFWYGPSVLFDDSGMRARQIAGSDINDNGMPLELDDLVYLTRVIVGEVLPFPRPVLVPSDTAVIVQDGAAGTVTITYPDGLRAVWLQFTDSVIMTDMLDGNAPGWGRSPDEVSAKSPLLISFLAQTIPSTAAGLRLFDYTGPGQLIEGHASYDGLTKVPVKVVRFNMPPCCQQRGDLNMNGAVTISDLTYLVNHLFKGGPGSACFEHADVNADNSLTVADLTGLVSYLFKNAEAVPCG